MKHTLMILIVAAFAMLPVANAQTQAETVALCNAFGEMSLSLSVLSDATTSRELYMQMVTQLANEHLPKELHETLQTMAATTWDAKGIVTGKQMREATVKGCMSGHKHTERHTF